MLPDQVTRSDLKEINGNVLELVKEMKSLSTQLLHSHSEIGSNLRAANSSSS